MATTKKGSTNGRNADLWDLFVDIASNRPAAVSRRLAALPDLASRAIAEGATRQGSRPFFLEAVGRHVYAGDTALHIAAAGYRVGIAGDLIASGANVAARNRRGAEPLHAASTGGPGSAGWNPDAQAKTIAYLIRAGAEPDAADKSGVTALHRAVRTRCAAAVRELLAHGAAPRRANGNGATPLHLAVQNTGRGGSGGEAAKEQQAEIVRLLIEHGARATDRNANGKTVAASVASEWIRELLST